MSIDQVTNAQYNKSFENPFHVFNREDFNQLNAFKCDEIKYLVYAADNPKIGMICGVKDSVLLSPFSAPFGGPTFSEIGVRLQYVESFIVELEKFAKKLELSEIKITLPPLIYNETFLSKLINVFFRSEYLVSTIDLNYSFNTKKFNETYQNNIWRNARKNLNVSFKSDLSFKKVEGEGGLREAYEIIQTNRASKGFPLRMGYDEVFKTSKIVSIDTFLIIVKNISIASAIVYHVADRIVQVVYWGDIPNYSNLKPMNFLSFKIFEYYKNNDIEIIDIGPSTENGNPNYGLCEFKEGIGCDISLKYTFSKKIS